MASSSSTYFQGGDYVELLSAQGKAPAATWKLQGKILKSFEKDIKGNAFQLDGSSETKMQLPKTATTQSLGLAQRFVVFQLSIPFTPSFSIEIGFSDFQKIRRRFVFASAFRETARTSLHVQIPFDARVTRDAWINLVFDLQALTETYFPGSTFRSMEPICISGSCKLKRVSTMKDAPKCSLQSLQQQQLAIHNGKRTTPAVQVASHADMKDIPKQFVFSSGTQNGSIPTEYFVLATSGNSNAASDAGKEGLNTGRSGTGGSSSTATAWSASSQLRGKSAPTGAQKQKPLLIKQASSTRPASSTARPETSRRSEVQGNQSPPSPPSPPFLTGVKEREQQRRPLSSSSARSIRSSSSTLRQSPGRPSTAESPFHADSREGFHQSPQSKEPSQVVVQLSSSSKVQHQPPAPDSLQRERLDLAETDDGRFSQYSRRFSESNNTTTTMETTAQMPLLPATRSSLQKRSTLNRPVSSEIKTSKEVHRRARILAEIQQKLDILSDDDDLEAERNSKLFLQHTSISQVSPPAPDSIQLQLDKDWSIPNSRKSIFSFAAGSGDLSDDDEEKSTSALLEQATKSTSRLFDFKSLLVESPVTSKDNRTKRGVDESTRTTSVSASVRASHVKSSSPNLDRAMIQEDQTSKSIVTTQVQKEFSPSNGDDEDDRALAELLVAKRSAHRNQQQHRQQSESPDMKMRSVQRKSYEVSVSGKRDQTRLSLDDLIRDSGVEVDEEEHEHKEEQELIGESEPQRITESKGLSADADTRSPVSEHAETDRNGDNRDENDAEQEEEDEEGDDDLSIDLTEDLDENVNGDGKLEEDVDEQLPKRSFRNGKTLSVDSDQEEQDEVNDDKRSLDFGSGGGSDKSFDFGLFDDFSPHLRPDVIVWLFKKHANVTLIYEPVLCDLDDLVVEKDGGVDDNVAEDKQSKAAEQSPVAVPDSEKPPVIRRSNNAPFDHKRESQLLTPRLMKINSSTDAHRKITSNSLRKQQHEDDDEAAFCVSPPRKSDLATKNASCPHQSGDLSFSFSRRLASLLESTDWSQLKPSPEVSVSRVKTAANKKKQPGGANPHQPSPTKPLASSVASIELIYDPLLNCYFDPVANKYYALASEWVNP